MSDHEMTVTEAARHFADLVNRAYVRGESTILIRSGEPVAMVVPVGTASVTGRDWIAKWRSIPHLDPEEVAEFAETLEEARSNLLPVTSPWD